LLEDVEKGEWIARYSGEPLNRKECDKRSKSQYRVQVHKNLFLDAADVKHFEGRYINDPRGSKHKANARFAGNYATNICSVTGYTWIRIYATRKIRAGEEILIDYGDDFWKIISAQAMASAAANPTTNSTAKWDSTSTSSMWAAPAPIPDSTSEQFSIPENSDHHDSGNTGCALTAPLQTASWPNHVSAPAKPAILGHSNTTHTTHSTHHTTYIHFSSTISPIKRHTPSHSNPYMNEIYSFTQLHDLDDTILLPITTN